MPLIITSLEVTSSTRDLPQNLRVLGSKPTGREAQGTGHLHHSGLVRFSHRTRTAALQTLSAYEHENRWTRTEHFPSRSGANVERISRLSNLRETARCSHRRTLQVSVQPATQFSPALISSLVQIPLHSFGFRPKMCRSAVGSTVGKARLGPCERQVSERAKIQRSMLYATLSLDC